MEKLYLSPDGETIWVDLTVSLAHQADGSPDDFVAMIEDIGARKTAQAAQQRYQGRLRLGLTCIMEALLPMRPDMLTLRDGPSPAGAGS